MSGGGCIEIKIKALRPPLRKRKLVEDELDAEATMALAALTLVVAASPEHPAPVVSLERQGGV